MVTKLPVTNKSKVRKRCEKSNCAKCCNASVAMNGEDCSFDAPSLTFTNVLLASSQTSDLYWATRVLNFKPFNTCCMPAPDPKQLIQLVSKHIQNKLEKQESLTKENAQRVDQILNEIGYDFSLPVIRWLAWVLNRILKSSLDALYVSNIEAVLQNDGTTPVVLLPTHRSYADFILLAYIAFLHEFELPCVAAGMDFHAMFMMGSILRKCKAFYMKRRFQDDPLYKMVFNEYLRHLMIHGNSPIEFFIEGTRSRSSKSLTPKYGLLSTLVDSFLRNEVVDVNIVPVSLVYDKILEESLFAYEHLGIPKPKESTSKLFQTLRNMNTKHGSVYISFGKPISLRSCMTRFPEAPLDRTKPKDLTELKSLAVSVIKCHKELSVITMFNVVATAVANNIIRTGNFTVDIKSFFTQANNIMTILTRNGGSFFYQGNLEEALINSISHHNNLITIDLHEVLHFNSIFDNISLKNNERGNQRKLTIGNGTMQLAIPQVMLQLYINPLMAHLAKPALLLSILYSKQGEQSNLESLNTEFIVLNDIYSKEFVNSEISPAVIFDQALQLLEKLECIHVNGTQVVINSSKQDYIEIFLNALAPFSTGYLYAISVLLNIPEDQTHTNSNLLRKVQLVIESLNADGKLKHFYTLSLDLLGNALSSFVDLGVLINIGGSPPSFTVDKLKASIIANVLDLTLRGYQKFISRNSVTCKL